MTYKETLFFIGKCLTITHEEKNRLEIEQELKNGQIDWDAVVKVSTAQYVFPALYCNLKRAGFLSYLPEELVNYMIHITDLNRDRNQQIITQAKEINKLLLANNITPIFLKGTGFLLQDFYEDIAERMVGDIDFLVSDEEFEKTIEILKKDNYQSQKGIDRTFLNRHFSKMIKKTKLASVEIHYKMVSKPYHNSFNYTYIKTAIKKLTDTKIALLSDENQFLMTCFNKQMNDNGQRYKTVSLRSSYDLLLHSQKINILKVLKEFSHYFTPLNNFLASTFLLCNNPQSITFEDNTLSKKFNKTQLKYINFPKKETRNRKRWNFFYLHKSRISVLFKSLYNKNNRTFLFQKINQFFKPTQ